VIQPEVVELSFLKTGYRFYYGNFGAHEERALDMHMVDGQAGYIPLIQAWRYGKEGCNSVA